MGTAKPVAERFWQYVTPVEGCWEWQGPRQQAGYGQLQCSGKSLSVHRLSYEFHHGPIPAGLIVMHSCDNPPCVNPAHLSVGTHADNAADKIAKGRCAKSYREHTRVRKLTDDQVRAIRLDDRALYIVAGEHGVSETAISLIRNGKRKQNVR